MGRGGWVEQRTANSKDPAPLEAWMPPSDWGASENNCRARFYRLTREGRKQLRLETQDWEQTAAIIGRFFKVKAADLP